MICRSLVFFTLAAFGSTGSAFGWGCEGHQMVALLARVHLTPVATNAVDQLLRDNMVDTANNFCKGGGDLMAEVASWADVIRNQQKTGPWHYIDIPLGQKHEDSLEKWCEPVTDPVEGKDRTGCVVSAIAYNGAILRDPARTPGDRASALRYIIHFIGDMHQPLHTTDNNDHGGNCTSFHFFTDDQPSNLHSIWDSRLLARRLQEMQLSPSQYATQLDERFGGEWRKWSKGSATDWAWDGHVVADKVTYGDLVPKIPVETPNPAADCNAERAKVAALHIAIADEYYRKSMPVIDEQLAKAGYRLAGFLNQTFTK